jgi:hypothetical protein
MQWAVPVEREEGNNSSSEQDMAHAMEAVFNNKDLLKSIFEQLDLHEICIAATTCQLWNQVRGVQSFGGGPIPVLLPLMLPTRLCWAGSKAVSHLALLLCVLCAPRLQTMMTSGSR